jgi:membrane-bound ClpP family serine protease
VSRAVPTGDGAIQLRSTDNATLTRVPPANPDGDVAAMVIPPSIGVVLVLVGLALFLIDLKVTNHGLPTAGAILSLVAGGLALLGAGVPYSGVLLGVIVAVAMLMGGGLFVILGSLRASKGRPAITGREGMIGEVGTVRSPVGVESEGWVFVHGERWRAVLAFAPAEADSPEGESVVGVGRKAAVVGFGEGGVVQVIPIELPRGSGDLDSTG